MAEETRPQTNENESVFRPQLKYLLWVVGLGIGVFTLLPQVGQLRYLSRIWGSVNGLWLGVAFAGTVLTYAAAAVVQRGSVAKPPALWRAAIAQLAAMFAANVGPHQGVGTAYVLERFIEKSGMERRQAIVAVTLIAVATMTIHIILLATVLAVLGRAGLLFARRIREWQIIVAIIVVIAAVIFFVTSPQRMRDAVRTARASWQDIKGLYRHPIRTLELFGGSLVVTTSYIVALLASLWGVGAHISMFHAAAVYLIGSLIGSVSPTPGGLGVLESAFVAILVSFGIGPERSVAGVLLYRFLTFWLPILPGLAAFRYLARKGCL